MQSRPVVYIAGRYNAITYRFAPFASECKQLWPPHETTARGFDSVWQLTGGRTDARPSWSRLGSGHRGKTSLASERSRPAAAPAVSTEAHFRPPTVSSKQQQMRSRVYAKCGVCLRFTISPHHQATASLSPDFLCLTAGSALFLNCRQALLFRPSAHRNTLGRRNIRHSRRPPGNQRTKSASYAGGFARAVRPEYFGN